MCKQFVSSFNVLIAANCIVKQKHHVTLLPNNFPSKMHKPHPGLLNLNLDKCSYSSQIPIQFMEIRLKN
eukprot:UN25553